MSGGSYDYLCYKMEDAASTLCQKGQPAYRKAFGELMRKCAKAMHDIEWVDSCDMGPGDDEKAIMECIEFSDVFKFTIEDAIEAKEELEKMIEKSRK